MTKLAFSVAAMLLASNAAFANSDHYGSQATSQTTATVDSTYTASTAKQDKVHHGMKPATKSTSSAADEPGQGIWGN